MAPPRPSGCPLLGGKGRVRCQSSCAPTGPREGEGAETHPEQRALTHWPAGRTRCSGASPEARPRPLTIQDVPAQPPDQQLVLLPEGQKGPCHRRPFLLLLSVGDNGARRETQITGEGTKCQDNRGGAQSLLNIKVRAFPSLQGGLVYPQSFPGPCAITHTQLTGGAGAPGWSERTKISW